MRRTVEALFVTVGMLAWAGCQQRQEADEEPDTTVIKEKETVVQPVPAPPASEPGADVKMDVKTDSGGVSGEVHVQTDSQ